MHIDDKILKLLSTKENSPAMALYFYIISRGKDVHSRGIFKRCTLTSIASDMGFSRPSVRLYKTRLQELGLLRQVRYKNSFLFIVTVTLDINWEELEDMLYAKLAKNFTDTLKSLEINSTYVEKTLPAVLSLQENTLSKETRMEKVLPEKIFPLAYSNVDNKSMLESIPSQVTPSIHVKSILNPVKSISSPVESNTNSTSLLKGIESMKKSEDNLELFSDDKKTVRESLELEHGINVLAPLLPNNARQVILQEQAFPYIKSGINVSGIWYWAIQRAKLHGIDTYLTKAFFYKMMLKYKNVSKVFGKEREAWSKHQEYIDWFLKQKDFFIRDKAKFAAELMLSNWCINKFLAERSSKKQIITTQEEREQQTGVWIKDA